MGYETYGDRVGKLNGMPVYKMSVSQWNLADTSDNECFYWVGDLLFYHDAKVGTVESGGYVDLDNAKVEEIKQKWALPKEELKKEVKRTETRPVEEPKPDNDPAEPDRPHDELVSSMLGRAAWTIKDMLKGCNMAADEFLRTIKEA
jgi:hypothetical protein